MKRLPERQGILNSFLIILTIVNLWTVIVYFYNFPGLVKQLTNSHLVSILSYVLFSALVESLVILFILVTLGFLLPAKLLRTDFAVRSALIMFLSVIYIIPFHVNIPRISYLIFEANVSLFIALWTMLYITQLVVFNLIISKYPHITARINNIAERVAVLGAIYLFFDLLALGSVIITNWS